MTGAEVYAYYQPSPSRCSWCIQTKLWQNLLLGRAEPPSATNSLRFGGWHLLSAPFFQTSSFPDYVSTSQPQNIRWFRGHQTQRAQTRRTHQAHESPWSVAGRPSPDESAEDQVRVVNPFEPGGTSRRAFVVRLNRFLSQCGLGSRRGCEQIILEGRVTINGKTVTELGTVVTPEDSVSVDGKPTRSETPIVIALNKPKGYICSRADERDRMTIYALLPRQLQTLHHVGRLDKESEGLLLMTNRGDLSHHLIHPSKGAEKEYEVIVDKPMDQATMAKLVNGMLTEEGHAKAERAWMITDYRCHVVLKQGLKRQIRLMFYQLGFEVERLTRTRIGWLEVKGLPKGGWKQLTEAEVQRFFTEAGTTGKPVSDDKPRKKPAAKKPGRDNEDETPRRRPPVRRVSKGTGSKPTGRARYALPRPDSAETPEQHRPRSGPPRRGASVGREESSERASPSDRFGPKRRGYGGDREESPERSGPPDRSGPKRRGYGGNREDSPQRSGPPRRPRSDDFSERSGPSPRPSFLDRSGPRDRSFGPPSDRSGPPRRSGPPGRSGPPSRGGPKKPGGKGPRKRS